MVIRLTKQRYLYGAALVGLMVVIALGVLVANLLRSPAVRADAINATDFVITVDTTKPGASTDTQFTIPTVGGGYNYTVDCTNDGTPEASDQTGPYTCQFPNSGVHKVRIGGTFPRIHFNEAGDVQRLTSIDQWGTNQWTSMENAFAGATNLEVRATDTPDLSRADNLHRMFYNARTMTGAGANWGWDTSTITNMSRMFHDAKAFNQPIGGWNTGKVISFNSMFMGADVFNQPIGNWDTSSVFDMANVFAYAPAFNQPLTGWTTNNVVNLSGAFIGAKAFNQPLNHWNVSKVTNLTNTFHGATAFNQPLNDWDTSSVTVTTGAFNGARAFNQPLDNWDMSKVTVMNAMFQNASAFNQPIGNWDTSSATNMSAAFQGATVFNQPLNDWKTDKVTNLAGMFSNAKAFNQPLDKWNTSLNTSMHTMFQEATAFNQPLTTWNTGNVTTMESAFYGATAFDQPLGAWDMKSVTTAATMLSGAKLSIDNYDATLKAWAAQPVKANVPFHGGRSQFCTAEAERTSLINNHTWRIDDAGKNCDEYQPTAIALSTAEIDENTPADATLGTLSTTSPKVAAGNTYTYSLGCDAAGAQDAFVKVDGDRLKLATSPDYEANSELALCVRVTNSMGQTFDQPLTLKVRNLLSVSYDANGAEAGTAPEAREAYAQGAVVPVADNTGGLTRAGMRFEGWNTAADGNGTTYAPGSNLTVAGDTRLYALWRDANAPAAPAAAPQLTTTSDSGVSDADGLTNNRTPAFLVACAEAGSTITLYIDGQANGTVKCDAPGAVEVRPATPLNDGVLAITYTETDATNNQSAQSPSIDIRIDTAAPQGEVEPQETTETAPALNGKVDDPQATVAVSVKGTIYPATNNGDGTWSLAAGTITPALTPGVYPVSVALTDAAGNVRTAEANLTIKAVGDPANPANPTDPVDQVQPNDQAPAGDRANQADQADQATPADSLADTGSPLLAVLGAAGSLLVAGTALVLARRRNHA